MKLDMERDIQIDHNALDIEWLNQAQTFARYSQHEAQAQANAAAQVLRVTRADEKIKTVRSELLLVAREEGGAKNAQQEEAYYRTHPRYKTAKKERIQEQEQLVELNRIAAEARGNVFAFNQRKVALENLVRLHGQEYFAGPSTPRDLDTLRAAKKAQREESTSIMKRTMKRRKS